MKRCWSLPLPRSRRHHVVKTDYYLSNAPADTTLGEFTRVAKAEHRIEECIQRSKSEAGLADYEVRSGRGGIIIRRFRSSRRGSS